jgi:hypothetical protein
VSEPHEFVVVTDGLQQENSLDTTFWLIFVRWIAIASVLMVTVMAGCTINADYLISQDIKAGAAPIAAACAHSNRGDKQICTIAALK